MDTLKSLCIFIILFILVSCAYPPYNELTSYNYPLITRMEESGKFETSIDEGTINEDFFLYGVTLPSLTNQLFSFHGTRGEVNLNLFNVSPKIPGSSAASETFNQTGNFFDMYYTRSDIYPAESSSLAACLVVKNTGDSFFIRNENGVITALAGNSFQTFLANKLIIDNSDIVIMNSDVRLGGVRELYLMIFIKPYEVKLVKMNYSSEGIDFTSYEILREMNIESLPTEIHVREIFNSDFHYNKSQASGLISLFQKTGYSNYRWEDSEENNLEKIEDIKGRIIEYFEDGSVLTLVDDTTSLPYWNLYDSSFNLQGSLITGSLKYLYTSENDGLARFSEYLIQDENRYLIRNYSITTAGFKSLF